VFAFLSCPINISFNSQWRRDHNGALVFKVGFDDGNEITFAMRPDKKIGTLKHVICQRNGLNNINIIVNNVPVDDNVSIGSIEGQYIRVVI
jgi:hypothetical protein